MRTRRWVLGCSIALALLAIGGWLTFRWLFGMPPRPNGLSPNYAFVWQDFPSTDNKGMWMACTRVGPTGADCQILNQQGWLILDGSYKSYPPDHPLPEGQLPVDPGSTELADGLLLPYVSRANFPFIHLKDGTVLLPAAAYDEAAAKYREEHRSAKPAPPR